MKARYNFWSDRPRNVSRREYNHYQLMVMGMVASGFFSVMTAGLAITGAVNQLRGTESIPAMTIAEVVKYGQENPPGSRTDAVKLQGFLQAVQPLQMPDNPDAKVLRGQILLKAESGVSDELVSETLFEWDQVADSVVLSDGTTRLPIAFDLAQIPMQQDNRTGRPRVRYAGENARFSKPVAIEYADEIYPLSDRLKAAGERSSRGRVSARLKREFTPDGLRVLLVAAVEATPEGARIVDPLDDRLKVLRGTQTSIAQGDIKRRFFMGGFSIAMGLTAYILKKAQTAKWQEFVIRSNE